MNRLGIANVLKLTLLLLIVGGNANAQRLEDSIHVHFNDTFTQAYKLSYVIIDTTEGFVEANYADFPGKKAYRANYYNSWRTGLYTSWYPDGKKMETIIYQKGKRNGEYTLYDTTGAVIIKGFYKNNIKDGFWIFKRYNFYGKYNNGKKTGTWRWKTAAGKLRFEYKDGVLVKRPQGVEIPIPRAILQN